MTAKRRKRKRRRNLAAISLVVIILSGVIGYQKIALEGEAEEYQKKIEELEKAKKAEEARTEEIEEYKTYVHSRQYIEQEARDKLGLVYPDEIVFEAEEEK